MIEISLNLGEIKLPLILIPTLLSWISPTNLQPQNVHSIMKFMIIKFTYETFRNIKLHLSEALNLKLKISYFSLITKSRSSMLQVAGARGKFRNLIKKFLGLQLSNFGIRWFLGLASFEMISQWSLFDDFIKEEAFKKDVPSFIISTCWN